MVGGKRLKLVVVVVGELVVAVVEDRWGFVARAATGIVSGGEGGRGRGGGGGGRGGRELSTEPFGSFFGADNH